MLSSAVRHWRNHWLRRDEPYGARQQALLRRELNSAAWMEIRSWPGYRPTPLIALPGLAASAHVRELLYKDEGKRFGLKSFKALGGAYAVFWFLAERLRAEGIADTTSQILKTGKHRESTARVTVAAATDGNHGRSVAWGAQMFGCRCVIYLHENVSHTREREIAKFGAEIRRVSGGYDRSVQQCAEDAQKNGWRLVADTSARGGAAAPALVMQGYTLLVEELVQQLASRMATHIFVPAAVGGLAAAAVGHLWETFGAARPRVIAVQAMAADAIARSIAAGKPVTVPGEVQTFMACLAAAEVSPAAWDILHEGLDDVITIPDEAARNAMQLLAKGSKGDPRVVSGESGCAATAGFLAAASQPSIANALHLGEESRVVVIGSEGATDADVYTETVGEHPDAIGEKALQ